VRLLAALLVASLALTGQAVGVFIPNPPPTPPAAPAPQYRPEDLCSIEGRVVNTETGGPVNNASLLLSPTAGGAGNAAVSDASGRFAFQNVAPGTYRIMFSRPGYKTASYGMNDFPLIALERGQKRTDFVYRVTPLGAVAGRVVDEGGGPIVSAQVQLSRFQYVQGRKQLMAAGSAATNDLGEYRLFDIAPGKYLVSATYSRVRPIVARVQDSSTSAPAVFPVDPGGGEDYPLTFYPGTADPAAAARIEIAPGAQTQNIDFRLLRTRTVSVRGRLANPALGDRQSPITITLVRRNSLGIGSPNRSASVDRLGNFEFANVLPGSYVLTAMIGQTGKPAYAARQFLEVGTSNVEGVAFSTPPPADVRGRIRVEGQDAPPFRNLLISLTWRDWDGSFNSPAAKVNGDGSFLVENVSLDRYDVTVALPAGYYLKAIRAGGAEAMEAGLDLTRGASEPIEIVVSPHAGQVTGVVQNQQIKQPAAGAIMALIPQEKERRERGTFYRTATADQEGRFSLDNISPGEYKVFAWEQIEEDGAYMDPEFIKPLEDKGQAVTIREGDKREIQLNVIPR
jgi:protocatechuate 3,4-dioxygenase beta subunit